MDANYVYYDSVEPDFITLTTALDDELAQKNGELHSTYNQYNKLTGIKDVIVAYINNEPVGCASIKYFEQDTFEVKRVFVTEEYRRFGIAKEMMKRIEELAKAKGIKSLVLETSKDFLPAVTLYKNLSYQVIENYGQYKDLDQSVCMKKVLK